MLTGRWLQVATSRSLIWEKPWGYWRQPLQMQAAMAVKPSTSLAAQRRTSSWMCWVSSGSQRLSFGGAACKAIHFALNIIVKWPLTLFIHPVCSYYSLTAHCSSSNHCRLQLRPGHFNHSHTGDQPGVQGRRSALPHHSVVQRQEVSAFKHHCVLISHPAHPSLWVQGCRWHLKGSFPLTTKNCRRLVVQRWRSVHFTLIKLE